MAGTPADSNAATSASAASHPPPAPRAPTRNVNGTDDPRGCDCGFDWKIAEHTLACSASHRRDWMCELDSAAAPRPFGEQHTQNATVARHVDADEIPLQHLHCSECGKRIETVRLILNEIKPYIIVYCKHEHMRVGVKISPLCRLAGFRYCYNVLVNYDANRPWCSLEGLGGIISQGLEILHKELLQNHVIFRDGMLIYEEGFPIDEAMLPSAEYIDKFIRERDKKKASGDGEDETQ